MNRQVLPPSTFAGYVSEAGRELVQEWYDGLAQTERDELLDTVNYLQSIPVTEWRRPEFDKVQPPLHEIRCKDVKTKRYIRVYGVFDEQVRARFVLLYGNEAKKDKRDEAGQRVALDRNALLKAGKASTHGFKFEKGTDQQGQAKQGSADAASRLQSRKEHRLPDSRDPG